MTVDTTATGGALARPEDVEYTGLEDFDTTRDAVMPRLSIVHADAVFKDNLSGETFPSLRVILLGLVKQRILWDTEVDDDAKPMCKSVNFTEGLPGKDFPWPASGFDPANFTPDAEGQVALACTACALKEWGTNPQGGKTPWCAEQHTFPLLMDVNGDGSAWTPALFTVQKTGIKPSKTYLTSFARTKTPTYTVVTQLSLTAQSRGSVKYAVPGFAKVGNTEQSDWTMYAQQYRQIREFITSRPANREDDGGTGTAPTPAAAPAASAAASPAPVSPPATAAAPATAPSTAPEPSPAPEPTPPAAPAAAEVPATPPPAAAPPLTSDNDLPF